MGIWLFALRESAPFPFCFVFMMLYSGMVWEEFGWDVVVVRTHGLVC